MQPPRTVIRTEVTTVIELAAHAALLRTVIETTDILASTNPLPALVWQFRTETPDATGFDLPVTLRFLPDTRYTEPAIDPVTESAVAAIASAISGHIWTTAHLTLKTEPVREPGRTERFVFAKGPYLLFTLRYQP